MNKKLGILLAALVSTVAIAQPSKMPQAVWESADINAISLDQVFANKEGRLSGSGSIGVSKVLKSVTLNLFRDFHCPAGQICVQVMPAPFRLELPVTRVQSKNGVTEIIAKNETYAVRIVDSRRAMDPTFVEHVTLVQIQATYFKNGTNGPKYVAKSTFSGDALELIRPYARPSMSFSESMPPVSCLAFFSGFVKNKNGECIQSSTSGCRNPFFPSYEACVRAK